MADVTRHDAARLHHAYRATPTEANHVLALLSKMMSLAERWGLRPDGSNPCRHVERFPQKARERMLSPQELAALGEALAAYEAGGGSAYIAAAVRLLLFTGARLGEVLGLRWEWIDFERGVARLPDSKTGPKSIHLAPPALAVLNALTRVEGNPHVIVGLKQGAALATLEKPWQRLRDAASVRRWRMSDDSKIAGLVARLARTLDREPTAPEVRRAAAEAGIELPRGMSDVRIHDLRHAFASVAAAGGLGLPIIGKLLGHTQAATTQRYAHLASDPVAAAAAAVASKIAAAMQGGSAEIKKLKP